MTLYGVYIILHSLYAIIIIISNNNITIITITIIIIIIIHINIRPWASGPTGVSIMLLTVCQSCQYCQYCNILMDQTIGGSRLRFFDDFLTSSWDPHFSDFGGNLAPTCPPTCSQNPPKIVPRAFKVSSQLASCFRCLFHRFWEPLGSIFRGFWVPILEPS